MNNEYIQHHGIKGMKWGVRRNKSQSTSVSGGSGSGQSSAKTVRTADDYKRMKKKVDTTNDIVETGKKVKTVATKSHAETKARNDVKTMSDKELQQVVNRLNMEERYTQVMNTRATNSGRDRVGRILDGAGTALAIGSSALSIMIAIKELQK